MRSTAIDGHDRIDRLLSARRPGHGLPRGLYVDPDALEADMTRVFGSGWLFAGHVADVAAPGEYRSVTVGGEPLILWRGTDGAVRAFVNVCRHRGARLTDACEGRASALRCGYHQWTYRSDGTLAGARLMGDGFDRGRWPLRQVAVEVVAGLLFVCLDPAPPDFTPARTAIEAHLWRYDLHATRVALRERHQVAANWKILVENNRECYHCQVCHPEFTLTNYDLGLPGDTRSDAAYEARLAAAQARWRTHGLSTDTVNFDAGSWLRITRLPLRPGFVTETLSGRPAAPLLGRLADPDVGSVRLIGLPNLWAHVNCDAVVTTRIEPVAVDRTDVEIAVLVRDDATDDDCDPDAASAVLRETFAQDVVLCEMVAAGVASRHYEPGPYSPVTEASVEQFVTWYADRLRG